MTHVATFFSGIAMATFGACAFVFAKLWRRSRDRFFYWFALAFALLSVERVALLAVGADGTTVLTPEVEAMSWVYLIRLFAFVAIAFAVVEKNLGGRTSNASGGQGLRP